MAEIIVSEFLNNNEKRIALKFEYNVEVIAMIKTTEIYTHVTRNALRNIKSPLDEINIEN